ncbi:MAG TPA: MFS transporter [Candidatus Polarisedimenticolia bacterium]|nr:MFS transporter [Candidatus Polarisedimenticolia bacterium]
MSRDARLLFAARAIRMFGYGAVAVILVLYLAALDFNGFQIGLLLSLTLAGDTLISLWLTTRADRVGRRKVLVIGALLMAGAGAVFGVAGAFSVLVLAATVGVISPSGNEVGPFLAVEQASLSQTLPGSKRTSVFAWYNLVGSVATAVGALVAGLVVGTLRDRGFADVNAYRVIVAGYAGLGLAMAALFELVSPLVEARPEDAGDPSIRRRLGLHRSRSIVTRLAALFSVDALAGGLVMQSLLAYWFHVRFGVPEATLGAIFFGANLLAAASALAAARIASRIGLINTMVFTHLPSNVLLIAVPLMPSLELAVIVLLARFSISQMDVPTRQSYTMAVVDPDERSAAAGVTGIARSIGAAIGSAIAGPLVAVPALAALPFFVGGGLKIVYDLALWRAFRARPAPEDPRG